MLTYSPLRYPGGKRRLSSVVISLLEANNFRDIHYVEPYAGGAGLALGLLFEEYATTIHINDLSRAVYAFWYTVLNDTDAFCERIDKAKVTIEEWLKQREIYRNRESSNFSDLAFATLFLNRTNRSGILGGGVIGGLKQTGEWTIGVRFNKTELISRIQKIGRYRDRVELTNMDALEFIKKVIPSIPNSFTFFDPPYIQPTSPLYLNNYAITDHHRLADAISELKQPWIVTYDGIAVYHKLYSSFRRVVYSLHFITHKHHIGQEVMYLSHDLSLPEQREKLVAERMEIVPYKSRFNRRNAIAK
jgi:DNA adenine methylase